MSDEKNGGLLYGLEQRIPPLPAFFSALQHVLAGLVGIITPPLIIGAALGLGEWLPYLISMSLLASGIGTFLQSNRLWGIGAGMICMQGTSFAFLGVRHCRRYVGKRAGRHAAGYYGHAVWRQRCCRAGALSRQPLY
ncbi:xanthine permease [Klebsiella michiganensis]|uniref:Xanthine permease n=1 Tax=Klebsiella michiganensis TaxID=1134687 RepID=A0A7H4N204_9ENTR|nr:xanthine permease [Klebsiella michiganensis]